VGGGEGDDGEEDDDDDDVLGDAAGLIASANENANPEGILDASLITRAAIDASMKVNLKDAGTYVQSPLISESTFFGIQSLIVA
jgi:hypothetical protein